mgnify:CR=1 FL=1
MSCLPIYLIVGVIVLWIMLFYLAQKIDDIEEQWPDDAAVPMFRCLLVLGFVMVLGFCWYVAKVCLKL